MKQQQMKWLKYAVRFLLTVIFAAAWAIWAHAEVPPASQTLTIGQAIALAVSNNLDAKVAKAETEEARGKAIQDAAALLPQITGSMSQSRVFKSNLAAIGIEPSPSFPDTVIGPYNTFDARFTLVQRILDLNSIWTAKEKGAREEEARLREELAGEQVASAAALSYIENLRALHDVEDSQSNLDLSQRLATLAHHQHDAGVATGIDVARADTRVAQDKQRLIQAQLGVTQADFRLKRVIGIPLIHKVTLAEPHEDSLPPTPEENKALSVAQQDRSELHVLAERIKAESYKRAAARANFMPSISAEADYGFSGNTPESTARTGQIGGRFDLPIFQGGKTHGQIVEANGLLAKAQAQYSDTQAQIEEDVRFALKALAAEIDEMSGPAQQVSPAQKELRLAKDRYAAGVGDNIQVVTAQTSLADARKSRVDARARYADAQGNLAMSLGQMRNFDLK